MSNRPYKEGAQREDGKYYWRYDKYKNKEIWISKEQLDRRRATRTAYRKACAEEYYKRQAKKPIEDRNYFGKYDFAKDKYFAGVSASGKEIWYPKEKFLKLKMRCNKNKRDFVARQKKYTGKHAKIGDVSPDNPSLFCIFKIGNKPYYGSAEKLEQWRESRGISYRKRNIKYGKKRREILSKLEKRIKRGYVHPENGTIFWEYNCYGKEIWLSSDVFKIKREAHIQIRRNYRLKEKAKGLKNDVQSEIYQKIHEVGQAFGGG